MLAPGNGARSVWGGQGIRPRFSTICWMLTHYFHFPCIHCSHALFPCTHRCTVPMHAGTALSWAIYEPVKRILSWETGAGA